MRVVIWSKDNCFYCDSAKELLNSLAISYEEKNISRDYTKQQMLEHIPTAKTVPQIFFEDKYIGGYTELVQFIKNEKNTYTHT